MVNLAELSNPESLKGAQSIIVKCLGYGMSVFLYPSVPLSSDGQEGLFLLFRACCWPRGLGLDLGEAWAGSGGR